jgi:hypothetical protein
MSVTFCIKYALGFVTVEDVTWVFNETFGEELVIKVTELVKDDRNSGKKFKIFFVECDKAKQTKGKVDKLVANITKNATTGDKKGARITIDAYGHFWQVVFAKEQVKEQTEFKPSIVEETEPTVKELETAMEALQTKAELEFLHGTKRGAEDGEIIEPKRANAGQVITATISRNDPIYVQALMDTIVHFSELGLCPEDEES